MQFLGKNDVSPFFIWANVPKLQAAHVNFLILYQIGLLSKINFLPNKQNRRPNIDLKMLKL